MKKITLFVLTFCIASVNLFAEQWQPVNRTKAAGGEIPQQVNFMLIEEGKLYAATSDGIWVSASKNGGDWDPFGLQGQEVKILNFKDLKLALVNVPSSEDVSKTAGQLYKHNGSTWVLTTFNSDKKTGYMATSGFAQIRDESSKLIIIVPTWRQGGMWKSEDSGETWAIIPPIEEPNIWG